MATRALLADLSAAAAEARLPRLEIESVGGVEAARRVASGERFDLVFLASRALEDLAERGHVLSSSVTPLVLSRTAVAVRSEGACETPPPAHAAFDDADGVRAALRDARRIGYSTGPSGTALLQQIERWAMTDELGDRLVQARPGVPVAQLLADGEVDIGFQQFSELAGQNSVRILGHLPSDCAIDTIFSGGVAATAADPAASLAVLSFFASPGVAPIKKARYFEDGRVP